MRSKDKVSFYGPPSLAAADQRELATQPTKSLNGKSQGKGKGRKLKKGKDHGPHCQGLTWPGFGHQNQLQVGKPLRRIGAWSATYCGCGHLRQPGAHFGAPGISSCTPDYIRCGPGFQV